MEYLLKRYKKLNQKEKKGFTLVELLVVIAILAVLASVSVVGYLGFTAKAKHSNAMTELSQAKEVIRAELIDNAEHTYYFTKGTDNKWSASTTEKTTNEESQQAETNDANTTKETQPSLTLKYSENSLTYTFTDSTTINTSGTSTTTTTKASNLTWDDAFKAIFTDLATLNGSFYPTVDDEKTTITSIKYYANNSGKAQWTVSDDTLTNGDNVADKGNDENNKIVAATENNA